MLDHTCVSAAVSVSVLQFPELTSCEIDNVPLLFQFAVCLYRMGGKECKLILMDYKLLLKLGSGYRYPIPEGNQRPDHNLQGQASLAPLLLSRGVTPTPGCSHTGLSERSLTSRPLLFMPQSTW